jgi:hypothetical protein
LVIKDDATHLAHESHTADGEPMNESPRPDLKTLRRYLGRLVAIIVVAVIGLLALTFYLYARFTAGIMVAP